MKKIFSILVTTMLLAGMMLPMTVSAADPNGDSSTPVEIAAEGTSVISFGGIRDDDFTLYKADGSSHPATTASGGWVQAGANETTSETYPEKGNFLYYNIANMGAGAYAEISVPVNVAAAGNYNITVYDSSMVTTQLIIDDETYDAASVELHSNGANFYGTLASQGYLVRIRSFNNVPLKTDTEEITLKFTSTQNTFVLALDAVYLEKVAGDDDPEVPEVPVEITDPDGDTTTVAIAATGVTNFLLGGANDDDFTLYIRQMEHQKQ